MKRRGVLAVVSGFSGAGKGTLMKNLLNQYDNYALSISMTTRLPREGEENGREYFFVSKEIFEEKVQQDGLVEYACYCDNYYGTPREYVESQMAMGKDVLLEIEIQGALKVKEKFPEALLLFVMPPSAKELENRLTGRGTESADVVAKRLCRAVVEAQGIENYDYIVINDDLEVCTQELHSIIRTAHRSVGRNEEFIENMRQELNVLVKGEK
ncbi:guanylate kinase [Muribaculaceae bacterium]|jgi:guanylate kinase|nr:guanylate kinase [Lachnospiraceae bacterium]GFH90418.1 guanylate kinase [Lachnospiraceae bacterium]GFI57967.1 guanylate kinase [Muribaculaceae bacterium]